MPGVIGQAAGQAGRLLHVMSRVLLLVVVVTALGLGALVWRLGQGPLEVPWLADEIARLVNRHIAPMRLEIGEASLIWEGFRGGVDRPLDIRALELTLFDADGRRVAQVPEAELSLSMRALATGRIAPRGLLVQGARVRAVRRQDGSLAVDFSGTRESETGTDGGRAAELGWAFEALAHPPGTDLGGRSTLLSQLRRLQFRDASLVVHDNALGLVWRAPGLELDVTRFASGGVEGAASLALLVDERRLAATAKIALPSVRLRPDGGGADVPTIRVEARLDEVVPAEFASLTPAFAPLSAVQAPVTLTAVAELGADLLPRQGRVQARMAGGALRIGQGRVPVTGGMAEIVGSPDGLTLTLQRLGLPAGVAGRQSVVSGTATVRPLDGKLDGLLDLRMDEVAFADLRTLWPDGVGGPGAKAWITENITAGTAHDLRLRVRVVTAPDLSDGTVTEMSGAVDGRNLVVHWLRPVPPTQQVTARMVFVSPDEIDIAVLSGVQGGLTVTGGQVRLTGLAQVEQFAAITVDLGGPVPELLGVLNHPRINLLSRRPVTMRDPAGRVEGRLMINALPLDSDLKIEDIRIAASGRLSALRLGGIAAGRDLTAGTLAFAAGNDGLTLQGTATLAGIASQVAVEMDFRDGPPSQVIQKVAVNGTAEAAQLIGLGLGLETSELMLDGSAAVKLDLVGRRSGRSELSVRADMARLGLRADRLNWGKAAGRPAVAEAVVVLDRERLTAIERLRIEGDGVSVQGAVEMAGGAPRRLRLARVVLGRGTDAQGEIQWPRDGQPWVIRLSGASLDLSGEMARRDPVKPGEEVRGPPWNAELRVDRLVLGPGRIMTGVLARSDNDGRITRNARVTGRAGIGAFELSILPSGQPQRRSLTITAQDAGGLLAALDVLDQMRGGRLVLNASYDDSRRDHPLSGTAEISDFAMRDAPAVAKLLQAITVVGAVEAFSGPDLRFTRLVAPFRHTGDVIELADARAFSASLGMTAKGRIDLGRRLFDVQGTVVPAYFINSLLGRVPLLGKLVSPETGGGLFAMSYGVKGPFDDPSVRVNPLSAVTPGFLRGLFGVFESTPGGGGDAPVSAPPTGPQGGQQ
jgi:hypothetical protein